MALVPGHWVLVIWTRLENGTECKGKSVPSSVRRRDALAIIFADGIPVRAKDFSQSSEDGPRILPSMKARPGQREHDPTCEQEEHVGKSRARIERTSFSWGELFQMSKKVSFLTLPQGRGN